MVADSAGWAQADALGVLDALVFRRVSPTRWAHLGGFGRGRGWAGLIDLDDAEEPLLGELPRGSGEVMPFEYPAPERVLGPYYARAGALVRLSRDVLVVLGHPTQPLSTGSSASTFLDLARWVDGSIDEVAPSKRLADELEILHAVRAVTATGTHDLRAAMQHTVEVEVAVEALSCEVGVLRDGSGRTVLAGPWATEAPDGAALSAALDALTVRTQGGILCVQDAATAGLSEMFGSKAGIRSVLVLPFPDPVGGVLLLAHTDAGPRGFTTLCQQLGRQVVDAAAVVAHTAVLREELQAAAQQSHCAACTDSLTGLGNRLCWDEALEQAQNAVDSGSVMTVITLDLDGLKQVNDRFGHDAGDVLLQRCAQILRSHEREQDITVRMGGDEFALLLPVDAGLAAERMQHLRAQLADRMTDQQPVAASLGSATASPGQRMADTVREADAAMYAAKRALRVDPHLSHAS